VGQSNRRVSAATPLARVNPANNIAFSSGVLFCVGGPALVQYLRPSDEELVKRYNPDLQKRSAEQGDRKAQEFDDYVQKLKEWSKSDKSSMLELQPTQGNLLGVYS
jgi:hypothetical protein